MFSALWQALRSVGELFLPAFGEAAQAAKSSTLLRRVLHVLVVVLLFVLFYFVNQALEIQRWIPGRIRFLANFWLPILFLLSYALVWVAYWLWKLLVSEDDSGRFADIDRAWSAALRALQNKGLLLSDWPLFLILGQPLGGDRTLFQAARLNLRLDQTPPGDREPLHVFATDRAIYVSCPDLSLLAHQARNLTKTMDAMEANSWEKGGPGNGLKDPTLGLEGVGGFVQQAKPLLRKGESLAEEEKQGLAAMERADRSYLTLRNHPERVAHCRRRLQYLCRLIVGARHPLCPANGILVLLPSEATASAQFAADTEALCQLDLETARQSLQMLCPRIALVCDLETVPGGREFIAGFSREQRMSPMGQGFPLNPDLGVTSRPLSLADLMKSLAAWVCRSYVPSFLYHEFVLEESPENLRASLDKNSGLLYFLEQLHQREAHLGPLLARGLIKDVPAPVLFRGCYLAGTGSDSADQAFVRGIHERLCDHQDDVCWTEEVRRQEARYQRWARICYTLAVCLVVLSLGLVVLSVADHFFRRPPERRKALVRTACVSVVNPSVRETGGD